MRYYIIAGEASGDLHGSRLIKALRKQDESAEIRAWGGDKMEEAGATLVKHYRDLAFMGFVEVVRHLGTIMRNFDLCRKDISAFKPDVLVLIDYPGFNLRIAKWAYEQKLKVVYYISPQVWAWKEGRIKAIRKYVDKMLVILPFEQEFYKKWNFEVSYVGHPLLEAIDEELEGESVSLNTEKPIVALLPGSRAQEIRKKLPLMLDVAKDFPDYQFVVAGAPAQSDALYEEMIGDAQVMLLRNDTYNLLRQAHAAIVTSGTATLETALFALPEVVVYKGNPVSFWLAKKLVKVPFVSLVNLIMGREIVKELLQTDFNRKALSEELNRLLLDFKYREEMKSQFSRLRERLGKGNASALAAEEILSVLKNPAPLS